MNPDKPQMPNNNDDVDLLLLLQKAFLYFRRFRTAYIVAIVAGVVMGTACYFVLPKLYKSRMVLHPLYLSNGEHMQIIGNWDELLKRHEYASLAGEWDCDEVNVRKVVSIDASEILKVFTPNNPNGFYIDVKVKDNSILPWLQETIVKELNNSAYIREKVSLHKENIQLMIGKVKDEIAKVDSIRTNVNNIISNKEKNSSSLMIDVTGLNRQLIDLNEKLFGYQEELKFVNGVFVIQGFSRFDAPVSISVKVLIAVGILLGLVIAYIYTLIVLLNEKMRKASRLNAA